MIRTSSPGAVRDMPAFRPRRATQPRLVSFAAQLGAFMQAGGPAVRPVGGPASPRAVPPPGSGLDRRAARPALRPAGLAAAAMPQGGGAMPPTEAAPARFEIIQRAEGMLGIPYVWGGDDPRKGLDCSSFLSRAWDVPRQTTDTLSKVADPITKDELRAGDAMNLPTWQDPEGYGHVRMFDRWANPEKTKVWVYEETTATGYVVHRAIDYDPRYQPMRLRRLADEA